MTSRIILTQKAINLQQELFHQSMIDEQERSVSSRRNSLQVNHQSQLMQSIIQQQAQLDQSVFTQNKNSPFKFQKYLKNSQKRISNQNQGMGTRKKYLKSIMSRNLKAVIPRDITRSFSNSSFQGTMTKNNLNSIVNNAFKTSSVSKTAKNLPRHIRISRNSSKLASRQITFNNLKKQVLNNNIALDSDDFMAKYYPKILFTENKVARVINKYKNEGKRYFNRQIKLNKQFQMRIKDKANQIDNILKENINQVNDCKNLYSEKSIKYQRQKRNKRLNQYHTTKYKNYFWKKIGNVTNTTQSITFKKRIKHLNNPYKNFK